MTPRGTLGLCCVHIAQLMTHPAIYTLPFTLQLCYKPLGILQRVTKSQKVHISSHDVLQKSHTWGTPQNFLLAFIDELWKTRKIRILKKWKKIAGDIIILHMCTKNHNHMRYSSWDMEWDNFFWSFLAIFCPYSPLSLTIQKTKILKKWKKHLEMSSF